MDKGKIKNIIIIVLLLVNVFLAALVIADSARSGVCDAAAERSLLQALQAGGITVDDASVLNIRAIPACTLTRNLSREKRLVAAVLGSVDSQDQGGNIVMERNIPKDALRVAMCVEGRQQTSEEFARLLSDRALSGRPSLCFLIGSSFGLDEEFKNSADMRLSLSAMTFPHHLARVMLAEQIYRGFKIGEGSRYHK